MRIFPQRQRYFFEVLFWFMLSPEISNFLALIFISASRLCFVLYLLFLFFQWNYLRAANYISNRAYHVSFHFSHHCTQLSSIQHLKLVLLCYVWRKCCREISLLLFHLFWKWWDSEIIWGLECMPGMCQTWFWSLQGLQVTPSTAVYQYYYLNNSNSNSSDHCLGVPFHSHYLYMSFMIQIYY